MRDGAVEAKDGLRGLGREGDEGEGRSDERGEGRFFPVGAEET